MTFRFLRWVPFVLIALASWGCSDKPLSGGTYVLSQVGITQDDCNILKDELKEGHEIEVTVNDSTITINVADDVTPPTGTILGGKFTAFASKDADLIPNTDCHDMWIKKLTGTILKKNVFTAIYEFNDKTISGSDCADEEKIGFHPPRCTSTITFTATKK